ncbi:YigZ family protein [bacterium]|nr:YigZ family protein [bacterium]
MERSKKIQQNLLNFTSDEFTTLAFANTTEIKIKNSRFLGLAFPLFSVKDFDEKLNEIRKNHHLANHNCFAYKFEKEFRFSDDGEPSGTAGKPIFKVLEFSGLANVGLVVTRYFGGTLLGIGGLVKAYTDSAKITLETATTKTVVLQKKFELIFPYELTNIAMKNIDFFGVKVINTFYGNSTKLVGEIRLNLVDEFAKTIFENSLGKLKINYL